MVGPKISLTRRSSGCFFFRLSIISIGNFSFYIHRCVGTRISLPNLYLCKVLPNERSCYTREVVSYWPIHYSAIGPGLILALIWKSFYASSEVPVCRVNIVADFDDYFDQGNENFVSAYLRSRHVLSLELVLWIKQSCFGNRIVLIKT